MIVVVGAGSQVGQCLRRLEPQWKYLSRRELDLSRSEQIESAFREKPTVIVNCAAFTAVDRAGEQPEEARALNATAVGFLARSCERLVHISTDYVFSGDKNTPYTEDDVTAPVSQYGQTKLEGERLALSVNPRSTIVRTSWLYSEFNQNFYKRMVELGSTRPQLKVVYDQVGSPTYAGDLAQALVAIVKKEIAPGVYHYSNEGVCSWYDFALQIFRLHGIATPIEPILSREFPTPTKRPAYSVLDKAKIKAALGLKVPHWAESLEALVKKQSQS